MAQDMVNHYSLSITVSCEQQYKYNYISSQANPRAGLYKNL